MTTVALKIEAYFEGIEIEVQNLALALRERLEVLGPNLTKKMAWGFPCWVGKERVFSIIAHKDSVNLQLWSGNRLAGAFPERIRGAGKQLRHVKLRRLDEIDPSLDAVIIAAIELDAEDPQKVR